MVKHCPECGARAPHSANFCRECGAGFDADGPTGDALGERRRDRRDGPPPRHDADAAGDDRTDGLEPDDGSNALRFLVIVLVVLLVGFVLLVVLAAIVGSFVVGVGGQAPPATGTLPVG